MGVVTISQEVWFFIINKVGLILNDVKKSVSKET